MEKIIDDAIEDKVKIGNWYCIQVAAILEILELDISARKKPLEWKSYI